MFSFGLWNPVELDCFVFIFLNRKICFVTDSIVVDSK